MLTKHLTFYPRNHPDNYSHFRGELKGGHSPRHRAPGRRWFQPQQVLITLPKSLSDPCLSPLSGLAPSLSRGTVNLIVNKPTTLSWGFFQHCSAVLGDFLGLTPLCMIAAGSYMTPHPILRTYSTRPGPEPAHHSCVAALSLDVSFLLNLGV